MCGISGQINRAGTPGRFDPRSNTFLAIRPRGPDGTGWEDFHCHGHAVWLAHSRLSIIELSALGRQPMQDEASGWWITYNGEVYNYREIRDELRRLGCVFRSGSDTEVLLRAWAQWGIGALSRLNGMFAFAAFHPASGQLWLVRDRFGIKPLAWGYGAGGAIVFSSSVAAVAGEAGDDIDLDYCARGVRYKVYETAGSGSPFRKVRTVPAGGWVRFQISEGGIRAADGQWYDLKQAVAARAASIADAGDGELLEQCRRALEDAVRLRLRSDVPVAVALSGGLDSSSIAALASKQVGGLRGFTYGEPGAEASEGPEVQRFSAAAGVDVTYVWPAFARGELGEALRRTMAFQEAPFGGLSVLAQNEVYRSTRQAGFKVLLGGQGGDEIFAGYRKFFVVALREALNRRETGNAVRMLYSLGVMLAHEAGQARMYWENLGRYRRGAGAGFRLLAWQPEAQDLWGDPGLGLSERQIEDIQRWSLPTLLRYEDRNSMGYGVESRLPFMDYRLLELALALPARLKTRNGYGKWALRQATAGCVPDTVRLKRKKRGFDVTQGWIRGGIGEALRGMIFDRLHMVSGHLRRGVSLDTLLSDESLAADGNLLDEAMMLAWLTEPVRPPVALDLAECVQ